MGGDVGDAAMQGELLDSSRRSGEVLKRPRRWSAMRRRRRERCRATLWANLSREHDMWDI